MASLAETGSLEKSYSTQPLMSPTTSSAAVTT